MGITSFIPGRFEFQDDWGFIFPSIRIAQFFYFGLVAEGLVDAVGDADS